MDIGVKRLRSAFPGASPIRVPPSTTQRFKWATTMAITVPLLRPTTSPSSTMQSYRRNLRHSPRGMYSRSLQPSYRSHHIRSGCSEHIHLRSWRCFRTQTLHLKGCLQYRRRAHQESSLGFPFWFRCDKQKLSPIVKLVFSTCVQNLKKKTGISSPCRWCVEVCCIFP